jgi:hypothetical protein
VQPLIGHTPVSSAAKSSLCWQTLAKTVGPNISDSHRGSRPLGHVCRGKCVDLVTLHEDNAFLLRVFAKADNERLSYVIE